MRKVNILRSGGSRSRSRQNEDSPAPSPSSTPANALATTLTTAPETTAPTLTLIEIHVDESGNRLLPSVITSREMTRIFYGRLTTGTSWMKVSRNVQQSYFEEFRKKFRWDPEIEGAVQSAFRKQAGRRYNNLVNKTKHGFTATGKVPNNISAEVWTNWTAHWSTEKSKKKIKQASINRMTEVNDPGSGPSKHMFGLKSKREYERELMMKAPSIKRGSGTHASTSVDVESNDVYLELTTQRKKKRLYGASHSSGHAKTISSSYSSAPQATPSCNQEITREEINEVIQMAVTQNTQKMTQMMQSMFDNMMNLMEQNMPPPSSDNDPKVGDS